MGGRGVSLRIQLPYRSSGHSNAVAFLSECQKCSKDLGSQGCQDNSRSWPGTPSRAGHFLLGPGFFLQIPSSNKALVSEPDERDEL